MSISDFKKAIKQRLTEKVADTLSNTKLIDAIRFGNLQEFQDAADQKRPALNKDELLKLHKIVNLFDGPAEEIESIDDLNTTNFNKNFAKIHKDVFGTDNPLEAVGNENERDMYHQPYYSDEKSPYLESEQLGDHLMQMLADKDINATVKGGVVYVDNSDVAEAKKVLKKMHPDVTVKGGLNA